MKANVVSSLQCLGRLSLLSAEGR